MFCTVIGIWGGFAWVKMDTVCGILEEKLRPPPSPPPRQNLRELHFIFSKNKIFSSNRSIWVPKYAEFKADFENKDKFEKKARKSYYQKTGFC